MEHVVFFPAHDGTPAFRRVSNLEEAVRLVEHLRNVEGVAELSVHSLTEVPLAFKAFYRVEVPVSDVAPSAVAVAPIAEAAPALALVEPLTEPAPVDVVEQPEPEAPAAPLFSLLETPPPLPPAPPAPFAEAAPVVEDVLEDAPVEDAPVDDAVAEDAPAEELVAAGPSSLGFFA